MLTSLKSKNKKNGNQILTKKLLSIK